MDHQKRQAVVPAAPLPLNKENQKWHGIDPEESGALDATQNDQRRRDGERAQQQQRFRRFNAFGLPDQQRGRREAQQQAGHLGKTQQVGARCDEIEYGKPKGANQTNGRCYAYVAHTLNQFNLVRQLGT